MGHSLHFTSSRARVTASVVLLLLLSLFSTTPARAATVTFSGNNATSPDGTFNRPTNCVSLDANRPYTVHPFWVSASGGHTLGITSASFDTIIALYQHTFNPADPLSNCVDEDDDGAGYPLSRITINLTARTQYFLVVYGFGASTGNYSGDITGPGGVTLGYMRDVTSGTVSVPVKPPDDRLNWRQGDDLAVIYARRDSLEQPAIHIYCVGQDSRGLIGLVVTEADLAAVPAHPANNTLVASSSLCQVDFYVLTTGEYQVNIIAPSAKNFITIMNDLAGTGRYGYMFEP